MKTHKSKDGSKTPISDTNASKDIQSEEDASSSNAIVNKMGSEESPTSESMLDEARHPFDLAAPIVINVKIEEDIYY